MGQFNNLQSADGFLVPAYVAQPDGAPRGAVVVLQEIFGVNSHIRSVADGYAAAGYLAVAPSTFHRVKPGAELGYTDEDMKAGFALKTAVEELPARPAYSMAACRSCSTPGAGRASTAVLSAKPAFMSSSL